MSEQSGSGLINDIMTLSIPIGLAITANSFNSGEKQTQKSENEQEGGFFESSFLKEIGLSIVPFSLLAINDALTNKELNESKELNNS
jgi:hypothetical protein